MTNLLWLSLQLKAYIESESGQSFRSFCVLKADMFYS